jgi:germination protein M
VIRTIRSSLVPLAVLALGIILVAGACTPTAGSLGTPSTPAPSTDASVEIPSSDATPGTPAPSDSPSSPRPSGTDETPPATLPPATPTPNPTATPAPVGTIVVRAYFFLGNTKNRDGQSTGITPVLREVPQTPAVAAAALRALLAGPSTVELATNPALRTEIPAGVRLLGVTIKAGVATVDLSSEFGAGGDINAVWGRIAQVTYTVTQFSTVKTVQFDLDGEPAFPGGIALVAPVGRDDFTGVRPAIFVDRPAWGAAAGNPAVISGLANVFEATFRVQLLASDGGVLADQQVMANCGTGCWGDFRTSITYSVSKPQWGTLRVFDLSAADGTPQDVTEYPVWLTPAG